MNFLWEDYLCHHGIKGQKWGIRRFQNYDGTLINKKTVKKAIDIYKAPIKVASKLTNAEIQGTKITSKAIIKQNRDIDKSIRKTIDTAGSIRNPYVGRNTLDNEGDRFRKRSTKIVGQLYDQAINNANMLGENNPNPVIAKAYSYYKAELDRLNQEELESMSINELEDRKDILIKARKEVEKLLKESENLPVNSKHDGEIKAGYVEYYKNELDKIDKAMSKINKAEKKVAERVKDSTVNWNKPGAQRVYANKQVDKQVRSEKQQVKDSTLQEVNSNLKAIAESFPTPTDPLRPVSKALKVSKRLTRKKRTYR